MPMMSPRRTVAMSSSNGSGPLVSTSACAITCSFMPSECKSMKQSLPELRIDQTRPARDTEAPLSVSPSLIWTLSVYFSMKSGKLVSSWNLCGYGVLPLAWHSARRLSSAARGCAIGHGDSPPSSPWLRCGSGGTVSGRSPPPPPPSYRQPAWPALTQASQPHAASVCGERHHTVCAPARSDWPTVCPRAALWRESGAQCHLLGGLLLRLLGFLEHVVQLLLEVGVLHAELRRQRLEEGLALATL